MKYKKEDTRVITISSWWCFPYQVYCYKISMHRWLTCWNKKNCIWHEGYLLTCFGHSIDIILWCQLGPYIIYHIKVMLLYQIMICKLLFQPSAYPIDVYARQFLPSHNKVNKMLVYSQVNVIRIFRHLSTFWQSQKYHLFLWHSVIIFNILYHIYFYLLIIFLIWYLT